MMSRAFIGLGLALLAAQAQARARPAAPAAFTYEGSETVNGVRQAAYRLDFDLLALRGGGLDAIVRKAQQTAAGGDWTPVPVTQACRAALHAPPGAIARVHIWPTANAADPLGPKFLDLCAPGGVFFPLTDIVNVAAILVSPQFRVGRLRTAGQTVRFPAFTAAFSRDGRRFEEVVAGGDATLVSSGRDEAVVEWRPDTAQLSMREPTPQGGMDLHGTEHWAFRVGFAPRTHALRSARTIYDDIDVVVQAPGLAADKAPRLKIVRQVGISPRPPG